MMQARVALMAFSFLLSVTAAGDTTTGRCPLLVERCLTYATGISVSLASDGSSGVYAYVGAGEILKIVDVSNAAKPVVVESLVLSDDITTIVAREDFVYVWMVDGSLRVVDVRNPRAPQEFGSLEDEGTSGWVDVEISGGSFSCPPILCLGAMTRWPEFKSSISATHLRRSKSRRSRVDGAPSRSPKGASWHCRRLHPNTDGRFTSST